MAGAVVAAAVENPLSFSSLFGFGKNEDVESGGGGGADTNLPETHTLDVSTEEFHKLEKYALLSRYSMILICAAMVLLAWYNIIFASSLATACLAIYLFFFSFLICCYEVAFRQAATFIVQNFGFLYNGIGRCLFFLFIATLCFHLSIFGEVVFGFLICYLLFQAYVYVQHPSFDVFLKKLHYFDRVGVKR